MNNIKKDYTQVIEDSPKNNKRDGFIYENLDSEINIFNPGDKITRYPKYSLKDMISIINKTQKWNLIEIKDMTDDLWEYYIIYFQLYKDNPKKQQKILNIINHYIKFLDHQSRYLDFFSGNILTLVATIFLPLTFITAFFSMNFKSMKKTIYSIKNGDLWVGLFSLLIIFIMGFQFNQVYHIFLF